MIMQQTSYQTGSSDFQYDVIERWGDLPDGWTLADTAGVAVDSLDNLYVLHRSDAHPVIVLDPAGRFVRSWGGGLFKRAHAACVGPDGSIYCVDDVGHALRKFDSNGRLLLEINTADALTDNGYDGTFGSVARSGPPFNLPTGVAISPEGHIITSDGYGNARVHRFTAAGELIASFGEPGPGPGEFLLPHGVVVDRDGRIYIADRENNRVQVFLGDGTFLSEWPAPRASSLCLDPEQNVYVTEMGQVIQGQPGNKHIVKENARPRVTVRDTDGRILAELAPREPEGDGLFFSPHSIAIDSAGNLYVAEVCETHSGGLAPKDRPRLHKYVRR